MASITTKGWVPGATVTAYRAVEAGQSLANAVTAGVADAQGAVLLEGLTERLRYTATDGITKKSFVCPDAGQADVSVGLDARLQAALAVRDARLDSLDSRTRSRIGYIDLKGAGCALDGVTDDTVPFAAAVAAAQAGGLEVAWKGSLRLTDGLQQVGALGGRPLRLRGDGPELSRIVSDIPAAAVNPTMLDLGGYGSLLTGTQALTVDALQGTRTLTMASTAAFAVGDTLLLGSTAAWPISDKGALRGELVRVAGKTGTTITLTSPIDDNYTTAAAAAVQKVLVTGGALLEGFSIVNARPLQKQAAYVRLAGHRDVTIRDVVMEQSDGAGVILHHCEDFTVDNVHFHEFANDPDNGRYGYGIVAYGSTRSGGVVNCFMRGGRHLFTTGSDGSHKGIPRHIAVSHCRATAMDNACFDSHLEGEFIHHHDCHAFDTRAFGMQIRSPRSTVTDCTVKTCFGPGLWLRAQEIKVRGLWIEDVHDGLFASEAGTGAVAWAGQGVKVVSSLGTHEADDCRLSDVEVRNTDQDAVYVSAQRVRLRAADLKGPGRASNGFGLRLALVGSTGHLVDGLRVEDATNGISTAAGVTGRMRGYQHKNVTAPGGLTADAGWTVVADV